MDTSTTYRILFFILLGAMLVVRMYFNLRVRQSGERIMPDREAIQHEGVGLFAIRVVLFFVLIATLILYVIDHPWMKALDISLPNWLRWLGFATGMLSTGMLIWTQLELGRQFSPQLQLRQEHQLITSGPYAYIRHPLYTALDGYGISLAVVSANLLFAAFTILMIIGLWYRVPKEEKMLLDQFGQQYQAYMQRTGRLLPKI